MKKTILILPAYNAARTLTFFLWTIPKGIFQEIILVDDCSEDKTYEIAKKCKNLKSFQNSRNLGYGGNLKRCISLVLERGADIIVELPPDGEYRTSALQKAILEIKNGADLVLGNRFTKETNVFREGMFLWKYFPLLFLNKLHNYIFETKNLDFHQGFRVYTKEIFEKININEMSNDYIFSFELITGAILTKCSIKSVAVETFYRGAKRGAKFYTSLFYGFLTFRVLWQYFLTKTGLGQKIFSKPKNKPSCPICKNTGLVRKFCVFGMYNLDYCSYCEIGFTNPVPKNLKKFYPGTYWKPKGILGFLKKKIFYLFQKRRRILVQKYLKTGRILDVGCGEGEFAESLGKKYKVFNLENETSGVENPKVAKVDFLKWKTDRKFQCICFWESLEHISSPKAYIRKAKNLIGAGGIVVIEYPRFMSLESLVYGKFWLHLDMPRHLFHFTSRGLKSMLDGLGFSVLEERGLWAPEYSSLGFAISLANLLTGKNHTINKNPLLFFLLIPVTVIAVFFEAILYFLGQAPIGLLVAKKK